MNDAPDQGAHLVTSDGDEVGPGSTAGPAADVMSRGSQAAWQAAIQPHKTTQHLVLWWNRGRSRQRAGLW